MSLTIKEANNYLEGNSLVIKHLQTMFRNKEKDSAVLIMMDEFRYSKELAIEIYETLIPEYQQGFNIVEIKNFLELSELKNLDGKEILFSQGDGVQNGIIFSLSANANNVEILSGYKKISLKSVKQLWRIDKNN